MPWNRVITVAVLLLAACVLPGCGGGNSGPARSVAGLPTEDANARPRDTLKDGGTIRWAIDEFPRQWNLNHLDGATIAASTVTGAMMPGTFGTDERAALTLVDDYVTSARITASKPRQVVTYVLNRKARWSDGKPITWREYAAQWRALRSLDGEYLVADNTGYERVANVERGKDDYEVVVTFSRPFAEWQSLFTPLYPVSTNSDPKRFNEDWAGKLPVSAGPFKLDKIDKSAQTITLVRNPAWWGDTPKLDRIVMRTLTADAAIGAFVNGEVDVVDLGTDAGAYRRARGAKGGVVRVAAGPDFRHLTFNATSDVMRDPRVRRAIALGINREAIAKADLAGLDWPTRTLGNHFFVNTQAGYRDNSGESGRYDPDTARSLLDAAGWRPAGTTREKDGEALTVRFLIPSGLAPPKQEAELTQAMLKEIGVKVKIVSVPLDAFFDKHVTPGDFDIVPFSWFGTPFPISSAQSIYAKPVKDGRGKLQIGQNFARVGSDEIDRLMSRADVTLDVEAAHDLLNRADRLIWELGHSLTLYQQPQFWGVNAKLANVGAFGLSGASYEDIGFVR